MVQTASGSTPVVTPASARADERRSRPAPRRSRLALLLVLPVALYLVMLRRLGSWLVDDAFISFAYARTLSETGSFAQAPGDPQVEGVSNPLWTLLLAGLRLVGVFDRGGSWLGHADYVWCIKIIATVCFVATLACLHTAARAVATARAAALACTFAGIGLAVSPSYVAWTGSGLENPLYGLLAAALLAVLVRAAMGRRLARPRVAVAAGLLTFAAVLTRPDGLVFCAAYPVVLLVAELVERRAGLVGRLIRGWLTFGLTIVPTIVALEVWRRLTFGIWLPNTAIAKGQGGASPGELVTRLLIFSKAFARPLTLLLVLLVLFVAVRLFWLARKARVEGDRAAAPIGTAVWAAVLTCGFGVLGFCLLERDWMTEFRFGTAAMVLCSGVIGVCLAVTIDQLELLFASSRLHGLARAGLVVVLVLCLAATVYVTERRFERYVATPTIAGCYVTQRYGELFNYYADELQVGPDGTLAIPDLGGTLMVSRLRIVDLAGLTEPTIARLRGAKQDAAIRDYILVTVKPTFLAFHTTWETGFLSDPRFTADYRALGSPGDYVRRDAVPSGIDLDAVNAEGARRALALGTNEGLRTDCGTLRIGEVER